MCPQSSTPHVRPDATLEERLMFRRHIDTATGCWIWTGNRNTWGYGQMFWQGGVRTVHQLAAELWLGYQRGVGVSVLHQCDRPACFNPAHLILGNHQLNMAHMVQRGRSVLTSHPGVENWRARLTNAAVLAIRARWPHETQITLAREFGVTQTTISAIVRRVTWRHI